MDRLQSVLTLLIISQGESQIFAQSRVSLFAFAFRVPCLVCKRQGKGAAGQQRIRLSIRLQGVTWPAAILSPLSNPLLRCQSALQTLPSGNKTHSQP